MKKSTVIIIAVVFAVAAFVAGMFYGKSSTAVSPQAALNGNGGTFTRRFAAGGAAGAANIIAGQIISENGQSVTIQLPDGNSQVVYFSPSTEITMVKVASGTASALAVGTDIIVTSSTKDSSGVVTANAIQVRQGGAGGMLYRVGAGINGG
ncbi:MAG: hypothetical protein KGJ13_01425 [Patescibacteria group bacterium]|nr:hypothetical protein [Patescibacteria group bacterium]